MHFVKQYIIEDKPSKYIQKLDEMPVSNGLIKEKIINNPKTKEVIKSTTDPDSGILNLKSSW